MESNERNSFAVPHPPFRRDPKPAVSSVELPAVSGVELGARGRYFNFDPLVTVTKPSLVRGYRGFCYQRGIKKRRTNHPASTTLS